MTFRSALLLPFLVAACGPTIGEKLYSREGVVQVEDLASLDRKIEEISSAISAPVRDRQRDVEGFPIFLLSNENVTVVIIHDLDDRCDWSDACVWNYNISATDYEEDETEQKRRVDDAFESIKSI